MRGVAAEAHEFVRAVGGHGGRGPRVASFHSRTLSGPFAPGWLANGWSGLSRPRAVGALGTRSLPAVYNGIGRDLEDAGMGFVTHERGVVRLLLVVAVGLAVCAGLLRTAEDIVAKRVWPSEGGSLS